MQRVLIVNLAVTLDFKEIKDQNGWGQVTSLYEEKYIWQVLDVDFFYYVSNLGQYVYLI